MDISPKALFECLEMDLREAGLNPSSFVDGVDDYWPGASAREVAGLRLYRSLFKKLNDEEHPDAHTRCLAKFLQSDMLCMNWRYDPQNSRDEELFGLFKQEVDLFLHPGGECLVQSYFDILRRGRAGPGASLGANGPDFYTKFFSSKLSATSFKLYEMYNEFLSWYPDWVDAELSRSLRLGVCELSLGNCLSFVRKNRDIARSICTEPSLNMFYQLGLGDMLCDRLDEEFNVNMETQQTWNRSMACRGSEVDDLVTIDLESASDSVGVPLCEAVLPEWFFSILELLRSPRTCINGEWVDLNMISSMGNGFTFPLQTMLFSCVVRAALHFRGIPALKANQEIVGDSDPTRGTWGVFGDDIICHREVADDVCRLLHLLGFRVNRSKSYFQGPFRESCGADYYNGQLVRGVYIRSLRTAQNRYVAINRLNEWSAVTGIYLPQTVGFLRDSVRDLAVPYWESDDAGIRMWHPPYPRYDANLSFVYTKYTVDVPALEVGDSTLSPIRLSGKKPPKKRIYNPSGLLCSFLAGYVRNCLITLALKQGERPRYRTVSDTAPHWDGFRPGTGFAADSRLWMPRVILALQRNLQL
jgi:hypothetical protein